MVNNAPQKNTDGSTMAGGQQNQFESAHPALLGEKHKVTVKNIQDLQDVEKYMFNNLQSLNKSSPDSIQQSQMIKKNQSRNDQEKEYKIYVIYYGNVIIVL